VIIKQKESEYRVFDPRTFAFTFEQIFETRIVSWNVESTAQIDPVQAVGRYGVVSVAQVSGGTNYEINVRCHYADGPPKITDELIHYFHIPGSSSRLIMVNYRAVRPGYYEFDLRYRVLNLEQFSRELEEARYKKFNDRFHSQLEDILE
jgi:hypothetical protein